MAAFRRELRYDNGLPVAVRVDLQSERTIALTV